MYADNGTDNGLLGGGSRSSFCERCAAKQLADVPGKYMHFTGSNMAGKSTTLKALTLAVWLAHCGLPVPVKSMICPLYEGIYTSINLPDSLRDGRSHFMAEVLRIKEVMQKAVTGNAVWWY